MSIAEFSTALKNKAIKEWFDLEKNAGGSASASARKAYSAANVNTLVNATSSYRSAEETAIKTSFIITKDTVRDLLVDLKGLVRGTPELEELTNIHFAAFKAKNTGVVVNRRKITVGTGVPAVYFSSISFGTITTLVNNIMNLSSGELAKFYEKGHVVGINTELLQTTTNRIRLLDTRGSTGKSVLIAELDKVIAYYKKLDYDSANIQPASDVKVYASINKSISKKGITKYLVELQPKATNQRSADEVKATIGSIRKLFTPANRTDQALKEIIDNILLSVSDPKFKQDLIDLKSSPDIKDMIATHIASTISGKPVSQEYNHANVLIATKKVPKVDLSNIRKIAKEEIAKLVSLTKNLKSKVPTIRTLQGQFYSLANLQILLNTHLQDVISANMGNGGERRVLNYRTGRFAESVKVERLSQSRAGAITAFYSYMRNPYEVFEPGHKMGTPLTRDPKVLIAKSIREIAATKVANTMRSVRV